MARAEMNEYYRQQIAALGGPANEDAFFRLIEASIDILPDLMEAYRTERDVQRRAGIVEIVWQRRSPTTIGFLSEALFDKDEQVWKQALDGLVTLGGQPAIEAMEVAKARGLLEGRGHDFAEWLEEAL